MKLITDSSQLEFKNEYDAHLNVYLNGAPFNGILKEGNEEIKYKAGNAIHVIQYYQNGKKANEEILENTVQLEYYSWFENGNVKSEYKFDHAYFNESGTVLKKGYSLYSNGNLASKSENGIDQSFSITGELISESKWTPGEKYVKEYYLNGVLKYHRLPAINKSFHYSDKAYLIIEKDETYGRSSIYFNELIIKIYIHDLYFSEGKAFGYSDHGDGIRINQLNTWLLNTVKGEDLSKFQSLNFKLCFCKDETQAGNAFKRIVANMDKNEIKNFKLPEIENVAFNKISEMFEKLKNELHDK